MATLHILTADELTALDLEDRWRTRRVARELRMSRRILRMFLERGGPILVQDIVSASEDSAGSVHQTLTALDDDDLILIRDGQIDIAYPFSASPTPFVVRLPDGRERYACCAMDALGIAPMLGRRIKIRSRCHHCGVPLGSSRPIHRARDPDRQATRGEMSSRRYLLNDHQFLPVGRTPEGMARGESDGRRSRDHGGRGVQAR